MKKTKTLSAYVGSVIKGEYKKRDMTLEALAEKSGIPYSSLRAKVAGDTAFLAQDIIVLAAAIGVPVQTVTDEAVSLFGGIDGLIKGSEVERMSPPQGNVTAIRSKDPRTMTGEEHDTFQGERAAKAFDPNADRPAE